MNGPSRTLISDSYEYRIRQLLRASGYPLNGISKGIEDLKRFIANNDLFFPEDITTGFVEWADRSGGPVHRAIAGIVRAGFYSNSGVESYASPCAPMVFGLAEVGVQANADRPDIRYALASTDISNLGGLNLVAPDRKATNPFLENIVRLPKEWIDEWAAQKGYAVDTLIIRSGGDEFKYIHRFRTQDGHAIDPGHFEAQMAELQEHINARNLHYSMLCNADRIPHYKKNRAPGVMNTYAVQPLAQQLPNIPHTLEELGDTIHAIRDQRRKALQDKPPLHFTSDMLDLPSEAPPPHHPVPLVDPYRDTRLEPAQGEALDQFLLRLAVDKAGFHKLADHTDLFTYHPTRRWAMLDNKHPALAALTPLQTGHLNSVIEAEYMRGVNDPISRCYSNQFYPQARALAEYQGDSNAMLLDLRNLVGMNAVSESLGDSILREVGHVIEHSYRRIITPDGQKPPIVRRSGGEFVVFLDPNLPERTLRDFSAAVQEGIASLNRQSIVSFATQHRLDEAVINAAHLSGSAFTAASAQHTKTIGDIASPKKPQQSPTAGSDASQEPLAGISVIERACGPIRDIESILERGKTHDTKTPPLPWTKKIHTAANRYRSDSVGDTSTISR